MLSITGAQQPLLSSYPQACSILYKTRLPMLLVFNKVDVARHDFAVEWMQDFEVFHEALASDTTYAASLSRCVALLEGGRDAWIQDRSDATSRWYEVSRVAAGTGGSSSHQLHAPYPQRGITRPPGPCPS